MREPSAKLRARAHRQRITTLPFLAAGCRTRYPRPFRLRRYDANRKLTFLLRVENIIADKRGVQIAHARFNFLEVGATARINLNNRVVWISDHAILNLINPS